MNRAVVRRVDGQIANAVNAVARRGNTPNVHIIRFAVVEEIAHLFARHHHRRRASAVMMSGEEVGDLFYNGKAYDVNVWSIPSARHSVNSVRNLPIDTPNDGPIHLG